MNIPNQDKSLELLQQVESLLADKQNAHIQGQGSRPNTPKPTSGSVISLKEHIGVINYEPSELVIKVRAGTLIKDIQQLLQDNQQQLGTDFPDYGSSTVGGAIATGETGSGRPFLGAIRDQVLGLGIINGKAKALNFGGQVMKNVAGYDVSRLLCGSRGQLAVITDVTLKVVPLTQHITIALEPQQDTLKQINQLAAKALPISAAVIDQGQITMRLSGSNAVTRHAMHQMKAKISPVDNHYWASIHNKQHEFFASSEAIWQVRLAATQVLDAYDPDSFIDWCGHQRYIKGKHDFNNLNDVSVVPFKNIKTNKPQNNSDDATQQLHRALKTAFDEHSLFNPL